MTLSKILATGALALCVALTGCGPKEGAPTNVVKGENKDDHDHGPGPHGGTVIELGKYHGEFTVDHDKKQATVYILDGQVKKAVPVAAEKLLLNIKSPMFQTELKAVPQDGDPKGKSSRFVATHDSLGKEQEFEGTVSGELDGKPIAGDFKEEHKDHKHKTK